MVATFRGMALAGLLTIVGLGVSRADGQVYGGEGYYNSGYGGGGYPVAGYAAPAYGGYGVAPGFAYGIPTTAYGTGYAPGYGGGYRYPHHHRHHRGCGHRYY